MWVSTVFKISFLDTVSRIVEIKKSFHNQQLLCLHVFVIIISFQGADHDGRTNEHGELHPCVYIFSYRLFATRGRVLSCYSYFAA